jgi:hypothetical protein
MVFSVYITRLAPDHTLVIASSIFSFSQEAKDSKGGLNYPQSLRHHAFPQTTKCPL